MAGGTARTRQVSWPMTIVKHQPVEADERFSARRNGRTGPSRAPVTTVRATALICSSRTSESKNSA